MQRQNYMITAEEVAESMGISLGKEILWIFPDCNVRG